jgi:hypothetical protein
VSVKSIETGDGQTGTVAKGKRESFFKLRVDVTGFGMVR